MLLPLDVHVENQFYSQNVMAFTGHIILKGASFCGSPSKCLTVWPFSCDDNLGPLEDGDNNKIAVVE